MHIVALTSAQAAEAARLHIAGQPGTFLTSLGGEVLTAIYQTLPQTPSGFGFAALEKAPFSSSRASAMLARGPATEKRPETEPILGFVGATSGVGRLFVEIAMRRSGVLAPLLLRQFARHPALIWRSVQTIAYPFLAHDGRCKRNAGRPSAGFGSGRIAFDHGRTGGAQRGCRLPVAGSIGR